MLRRGMNVAKNFILAMTISGGLAGLAGSGEVLGLNYNLPAAYISGYGFDAIAIALLAKSTLLVLFPLLCCGQHSGMEQD